MECILDDMCPYGEYFPMVDSEATFCASPLSAAQHPEAFAAAAQCASGWTSTGSGDGDVVEPPTYTYRGQTKDCFTCQPLVVHDPTSGEPTACNPDAPQERFFLTGTTTQDQCSMNADTSLPLRSCVSCSRVVDPLSGDLYLNAACEAWNPSAFAYDNASSPLRLGLSQMTDVKTVTPYCSPDAECQEKCTAASDFSGNLDGAAEASDWSAYESTCCTTDSLPRVREGFKNQSIFAYPSCMCAYPVSTALIDILDTSSVDAETMARMWTKSCFEQPSVDSCENVYACVVTGSGDECVCPQCRENIHCYGASGPDQHLLCDNLAYRKKLKTDWSHITGFAEDDDVGEPTYQCIPFCSVDPARGAIAIEFDPDDEIDLYEARCNSQAGVNQDPVTGCAISKTSNSTKQTILACPDLVEPTSEFISAAGCGKVRYSWEK